MAPTELLAEQHFRNISHYADALSIKAGLLIGSQAAKDRKATLERIAGGQIQFVIGTHALIQEGVSVPKLGLGVIDEQHRFGVVQRLSLQRLLCADSGTAPIGKQPHMLLMSATPIPRSLAMVLYGDMEVSFLMKCRLDACRFKLKSITSKAVGRFTNWSSKNCGRGVKPLSSIL